MGKKVLDSIIDQMLDLCEGDQIHVCSAEPATFAEATTTYNLVTDSVGTYTKANGDTSGRKNTQAGTTGSSISSTGTANHVVVTKSDNSIGIITTCPAQALTAGGTVDIGSFAHEIGDAS